jgi:hypothetical protein
MARSRAIVCGPYDGGPPEDDLLWRRWRTSVRMALWAVDADRQDCRRAGPRTGGPETIPGPTGSLITMDIERTPTAEQWRIRAMAELERVTAAERRFSASITMNSKVTMLAAADELQVATRDATGWGAANPCPDVKLGTHVAWMLTTCMEVAVTAQRALTDPSADPAAAMGRLGLLLAVIDFHSQTLDAW